MGGHDFRIQPLREMARHALGQPPRVHEDQRRAVLAHEGGEPVVDLRPDLGGHHRRERRGRQLDGQVPCAGEAGVDDLAGLLPVSRAGSATMRSMGFWVAEMPMRNGGCGTQRVQPLQREHQVRAALVVGERVQLVDDDRAHGAEHLPAGLRGQQDVERLRRGHQDVRRDRGACARARPPACHRCAPPRGCRAAAARVAGCRRAAPRGSCGCRWTAPSAARRRGPAPRPAAVPPRPPSPAHRWRRGRPPASCRSRWAPRAARGGRSGSPARPAPARASAREIGTGTSRRRRDGNRGPACQRTRRGYIRGVPIIDSQVVWNNPGHDAPDVRGRLTAAWP